MEDTICYLIGGAPRTGKTTLAKKLAGENGIKSLSTDSILVMMMKIVRREDYPDLFYTEMSNMFWKKVFRRQMKRGDAIEALASLLSEPQIRAVPSVPLIPAAFDWAVRFGCTVYAALYLAASAEEGIPLITADRSFWRKAKVSKEGADIVWLGDLA